MDERHVILRTTLEVNGPPRADGLRMQWVAEAWARERLLPAVHAVFAGLPVVDGHLVVERVAVDLDCADGDDWGVQAVERLRSELREALARVTTGAATKDGLERLSGPEAFFRKLVHYLRHGFLPWNLDLKSPFELDRGFQDWLEDPGAAAFRGPLAGVLVEANARRRLLGSVPAPLVDLMLVRIFGVDPTDLRQWRADATLLPGPSGSDAPAEPGPRIDDRSPVQEAVLAVLADDPHLPAAALADRVAEALLRRRTSEKEAALGSLLPRSFSSRAFRAAVERFAGRQASTGEDAGPDELAGAHREDWAADPVGPAPGGAAGGSPALRRSLYDPVEVGEVRGGIHVGNAGLVLVAPFLGALFGRLRLAEPGTILQPGLAIALLQYLATGEEAPREFEVVLPKILCGWPVEAALELPGSLPRDIRAEGDELLGSIIGHWAMLKNTSVHGLRESFLLRPGKLSRTPQGDWRLQVEQRAYDLLLQHLPWSFTSVRLSWMKAAVHTEWVT